MKSYVKTGMMAAFCFIFVAAHSFAGEMEIVGTGDGVSVLKAIGEAFGRENPDIAVSVPKSIGSGGGIKMVGTDKNKIGRVARGIKDKEKPYGLAYQPFAKVPTVFFVNKSVTVKNLSAEQICAIYAGETTNWKAVGGADGKIRVVRREEGDSSLKVLRKSFPGFKAVAITDKSKTVYSTPETFDIVGQKKGTIGFGPYDVAKAADVNILGIGGKKPLDADYPSFTTLALIYKEANRTGDIGKFIEFATSESASEPIKEAGGIPFTGK